MLNASMHRVKNVFLQLLTHLSFSWQRFEANSKSSKEEDNKNPKITFVSKVKPHQGGQKY